jgi:hypothetical protein
MSIKFMQLSVRELLILTFVAAIACAWWIEREKRRDAEHRVEMSLYSIDVITMENTSWGARVHELLNASDPHGENKGS